MKNHSFDLQLFAAFNLPAADGVKVITSGTNVWKTLSSAGSSNGIAYHDASGTYYVKSSGDITISKTFSGSVKLVSAIKVNASGTALATLTESAGTLGIMGANTSGTVATASKGTLTFTDGAISSASGTGTLTTATSARFKGFSGTVAASGGLYTLSSFTGRAVTSAGIDDFTSGTITTNTEYHGKVMGADFKTANRFDVNTNSNGDYVYNVAAVSTGQEYDLTNATKKNWNIVGSGTSDTFTTGTSANVTLNGGAGQDIFTVATSGTVSIDGGADGDTLLITGTGVKTGSYISMGAGDDSVHSSGNVVLGKNLYLDLGDGNDTLDAAGAAGAIGTGSSIYGGAGKDLIDLTNLNSADAFEVLVDGGAGNDEIKGNANIKNSTVTGGDGDDVIGAFKGTVTLSGNAGADTFVLGAGAEANIADYTFGEDYVSLGAATNAGTVNGLIGSLTGDGELGLITDATYGNATIKSSNGFYAVTAKHDDGTKTNLAWVGSSPVTVDASSQNVASVITGKTNTEADLLIGGTKADTIYASANDSVYGGQGNDSIDANSKVYGVHVGLSNAGGADTVVGFDAGWDLDSADAIVLLDGADSLKGGVSSNNADVTIKSASATMTLTGAVQGDETKLLLSGKKVDLIKKDAKAVVTDDSTIADYYVGTEKSGIDMTKYTGNVEVNLGNAMFVNITTVQAGSGNVSILGGKAAESLIAGAGATSLYGGAGVDTLVSGAGKTTFFANESSGKDVVTGFVVGADETSDVINVNNLKSLTRSDNTTFTVDLDGTNSLKVSQKSGDINSNIQWASGDASGVVKIGKSAAENKFSYDSATTNYVGSTQTDTVSLAAGTADNFEVWVDQTGDMFNSIEVYDFGQTSGNVLAAGKANTAETIVAGKGNSSLWGGVGATTDVLQNKNSSAVAEFFYGIGDGNDIIEGQKGDSVNLYNLNLSDITKATINSNNVVFTTAANETVTVSGSVGTFKLADGSTWTADYSKKSWTQN